MFLRQGSEGSVVLSGHTARRRGSRAARFTGVIAGWLGITALATFTSQSIAAVVTWEHPTERESGAELAVDELQFTRFYCDGEFVASVNAPDNTFNLGEVLEPGDYTCTARAVDTEDRESADSNAVTFTVEPETEPVPPQPPTDLHVVASVVASDPDPPDTGMTIEERFVWDGATGAGTGLSWEDAYTSLEDWQSAEAKDLVSSGVEVHRVNYRRDTPRSSHFSFSGWTTDADHYIHLRVPVEYRHTGRLSTGTRWEAGSTGFTFPPGFPSYTIVEGLSVRQSGNREALALGTGVRFSSVLVANDGSGAAIRTTSSEAPGAIINTIGLANSDFAFRFSGGDTVVINSVGWTFGDRRAFDRQFGTPVLVSCWGHSEDADAFEQFNMTTINSYSSDGNHVSGQVTIAQAAFAETGASLDDLHLILTEESDLIDLGQDNSSNAAWFGDSVDIFGTARPQGAEWDVGAHEYISTVETTVDAQASLGVSAGVASLGSAEAQSSASLDLSAGVSAARQALISASATMAVEAGASTVGAGEASASASLPADVGFSGDADESVVVSATLAAQLSLSGQAQAEARAAATLLAIQTLAAQGAAEAQAAGNLDAAAALSALADEDVVEEAAASLGISAAITGAGAAESQAAASLIAQGALTVTAQAEAQATVTLATQAGVFAVTGSIEDAAGTVAALVGLSSAGQAEALAHASAEAALSLTGPATALASATGQLEFTAQLAGQASSIAQAAAAIGAVMQLSGFEGELIISLPDGRVLTVSREDRTLVVSAENQTFRITRT